MIHRKLTAFACLCVQDSAKAAEALLLEKDAFLTSHKYLMDKARILHSTGKINVFHASFSLFFSA